MYSDIEIEWSESMKRYVVTDSGRFAGSYETYEEAQAYKKTLENYYYGK